MAAQPCRRPTGTAAATRSGNSAKTGQQRRERPLGACPPQVPASARRGADEDTGQPVVGGDQAGGDAVAVRPLVADGRQVGVVAVQHRPGRAPLPHERGAGLGRDGRADAVSAYRHGRLQLPSLPCGPAL